MGKNTINIIIGIVGAIVSVGTLFGMLVSIIKHCSNKLTRRTFPISVHMTNPSFFIGHNKYLGLLSVACTNKTDKKFSIDSVQIQFGEKVYTLFDTHKVLTEKGIMRSTKNIMPKQISPKVSYEFEFAFKINQQYANSLPKAARLTIYTSLKPLRYTIRFDDRGIARFPRRKAEKSDPQKD